MTAAREIGGVVPNPGSDEAIKAGCICAVLDNHHGAGCGTFNEDGTPHFWIRLDCPIHACEETSDAD